MIIFTTFARSKVSQYNIAVLSLKMANYLFLVN